MAKTHILNRFSASFGNVEPKKRSSCSIQKQKPGNISRIWTNLGPLLPQPRHGVVVVMGPDFIKSFIYVLIRDLSQYYLGSSHFNTSLDSGQEMFRRPIWCTTFSTQITHSTTQHMNFALGYCTAPTQMTRPFMCSFSLAKRLHKTRPTRMDNFCVTYQ